MHFQKIYGAQLNTPIQLQLLAGATAEVKPDLQLDQKVCYQL